jgi:glycosyltransferase involved in cell wall biosynthesis
MKRIVGIISFMNQGGAQEAILRLMHQLRLRGYDADVWFLYAQDYCYGSEPGARLLRRDQRLGAWTYVSLLYRLWRDLRRERADAVIGFLPLGSALGLSAAMLAGVRSRVASQRTPRFALTPLMRRVDRVLGTLPIYKAIVCVGAQVRDSFAENPARYRAKLSVVPNGIDWNPSSLDKQAARARLGLPKDSFVFAASGRFGPQKNYPFLVKVAQRVPDAHFAFAGDGEQMPQTRELAHRLGISERTHFLGSLPRTDIPHLLRAADAFVHPSLFEGHSNSILEALNEGLAVVANDVATIRETLEDENGQLAALLCDPNVDDWARALSRLRDDPALVRRFGEQGYALVQRRFTLNAMVDSFEAILLSLAKGTPSDASKRAAA